MPPPPPINRAKTRSVTFLLQVQTSIDEHRLFILNKTDLFLYVSKVFYSGFCFACKSTINYTICRSICGQPHLLLIDSVWCWEEVDVYPLTRSLPYTHSQLKEAKSWKKQRDDSASSWPRKNYLQVTRVCARCFWRRDGDVWCVCERMGMFGCSLYVRELWHHSAPWQRGERVGWNAIYCGDAVMHVCSDWQVDSTWVYDPLDHSLHYVFSSKCWMYNITHKNYFLSFKFVLCVLEKGHINYE